MRHDGDAYIAQIVRPEKSIWYYKDNVTNLKVIEKERKLSAPLAERAKQLWQTMLLRTKFQRPNTICDGIYFTFIATPPGYSQLTAESHNPETGTKPFLLASIGIDLIAYVESGPEGTPKIETQLQHSMDRLEQALNNEKPSNHASERIRRPAAK